MSSKITAFIPVDQVTASAASIINGVTERDRLYFKQWVYLGLREIGPGKHNIDVCTLYPNDLSFKKPDDVASIIDIALFSNSGQEFRYTYRPGKKRIHISRNNKLSSGVGLEYNRDSHIDLSEDDYYLHMGTGGEKVDYASIRYFKLPIDDTGLPLIPSNQEFAIMMFIRYMWSLRKNDNRSEIDQNHHAWLKERDRAKSRNKMPSELEGKEIAKHWMSMIPKPFFDNY